jgi:tricarballylate dehydrogenase
MPEWMSEHGIRWQQPLSGTLHLGRTNRFFLGGGKALINTYHRTAQRLGIHVEYGVTVERILVDGNRCTGLLAKVGGAAYRIDAGAVVCAAGGFEANLEWLGRYWGEAAENYIVRGPATTTGPSCRLCTTRGRPEPARRRASMPSPSMRGHPATTAASPPGWTSSRSA